MILNVIELKILEIFSSDYSQKIYGRSIAKKLKINQKTTANVLNRLEKEHILKFTKEGRNKYYFLNKLNCHIKDIIKLIEINKKIRFLEKNKKIYNLFEKLEQRASGLLIIFGSYASNTQTKESDLDIFVVGKILDIDDLEDSYNLKINIVRSSKSKFNKAEVIIKEVIRNHIVLKGIEDFVGLI